MNIIYQSTKFDEKDITSTYIRKYSNGEVKFFDVNAKQRTIREYWINEYDCNDSIKSAQSGETVKL